MAQASKESAKNGDEAERKLQSLGMQYGIAMPLPLRNFRWILCLGKHREALIIHDTYDFPMDSLDS